MTFKGQPHRCEGAQFRHQQLMLTIELIQPCNQERESTPASLECWMWPFEAYLHPLSAK